MGESSDVFLVDIGETGMTLYRCYLADGLLPQNPMEAKIVKKNAGIYVIATR